MAAIDSVEEKVAAAEAVGAKAIALLQTLSQLLKDAMGDTARMEALAARIDAGTQVLEKAVVDNTPA